MFLNVPLYTFTRVLFCRSFFRLRHLFHFSHPLFQWPFYCLCSCVCFTPLPLSNVCVHSFSCVCVYVFFIIPLALATVNSTRKGAEILPIITQTFVRVCVAGQTLCTHLFVYLCAKKIMFVLFAQSTRKYVFHQFVLRILPVLPFTAFPLRCTHRSVVYAIETCIFVIRERTRAFGLSFFYKFPYPWIICPSSLLYFCGECNIVIAQVSPLNP